MFGRDGRRHEDALHRRSMRLSGLEPGGPSDDLTAWAQRLQGITMVGLGEATHGSREFFTLKHRLIEHLVTEQGFTTFAVEADRELCRPLDDFLRDGSGDPARLLRELGYWTWCTEEVLALIRWLREHNAATPPHRSVRLVGVDPPHRRPRGLAGREEAMARALLELGDQRSVFWGHNGHVCTGRVNGRTPSTGARVRDELGSGYYALGLTFHQGAFGVLSRTRQGVRGPQERAVGEAPTRSLEHALAATGPGDRLVELRGVQQDSELGHWAWRRNRMRSVGSVAVRGAPDPFCAVVPARDFDAIALVRRTTPARPLPSP